MRKKILSLLMFLSFSLAVSAHGEIGRISIHAQIGVSTNEWGISGSESNVNLLGNKFHMGLMGGVELGYRFNRWIRPSVGVLYQSQGLKFDSKKSATLNEDQSYTLGYITIPVMLNLHLTDNFSLKAGVQPAYRLSTDHLEYNSLQDDNLKKMDVQVPVGIQWEMMGITFDVRAYYGLTNLIKKVEDGEKLDASAHNQGFTVTVGYKFDL